MSKIVILPYISKKKFTLETGRYPYFIVTKKELEFISNNLSYLKFFLSSNNLTLKRNKNRLLVILVILIVTSSALILTSGSMLIPQASET